MQTFEGNIEHFDPSRPFAGDEKVPVQFYMGVVKDDVASDEAKRPIFKDVECIKIFNSKDNIIDRPVRDTDKMRWPGKYQAWKASGVSEVGSMGMRLDLWPQMTRAQAEEYKYFKIFTVEQLAETPDSIGQQLMGFAQLKRAAQAYVLAAKEAEPLLRMQAELDKRDLQIAELTDAVKKLTKIVEGKKAA